MVGKVFNEGVGIFFQNIWRIYTPGSNILSAYQMIDIKYTYRFKKSGTGHFCDKKQMNQHIAMQFTIHTIQPIIQVMWTSYNHTLKIVEMRAIWKKSSENRFCEKVAHICNFDFLTVWL